jgi:RimJ/RimL family protein N-acetyltransferase
VPGDLHTPRLHVRPLAVSDERLYCGLYADPEVMRHVAEPLATDAARRAFSAILKQLAADPPRSRYWTLHPHDGGGALGLMAWVPDHDDAGSGEVGVVLARPAACRGYATESVAALADAVFARNGQRRLWARHAPGNGPAAGLMRKLGFAPLAEARSASGLLRWELERKVWLDRRARAFASPLANC